LLRSGELEASVEDARAPGAAAARQLTDTLAGAWLSGARLDERELAEHLDSVHSPDELRVTRPEGYAYYALNPGNYANWVKRCAWSGRDVAVIGVRSIGTSLSAIVRAQLAGGGCRAARITVRPQGHPWDRQLELAGEALELVRAWHGAEFLVVDEGPGLSGSTFLAVGEALQRANIPTERIRFLTSHAVDPDRLLARDGARRWASFRADNVSDDLLPPGALDFGGGAWRQHVYTSEAEWPACWTGLERRKYRIPGSDELVKFVGFPPYGEAPLERGQCLADAGFSPALRRHSPGYLAQVWRNGKPLQLDANRIGALTRLLDYVVFRSRACAAPEAPAAELEALLRVNVAEALGVELPRDIKLEVVRPVFADGRLLPREWITTDTGELLKVDAIDHADDHLLPGPCDIAWDLAGAAIEWQLSRSEVSWLLDGYRSRTGDAAERRIAPYLMAYAAFRVGYVDLALLSSAGAEQTRLANERRNYMDALRRAVADA
jgi:hypothetical protein